VNVDRRIGYVEVSVDGNLVVRCECGGEMAAEVGTTIDDPAPWERDGKMRSANTGAARYMWWRCERNPKHITRALPLPVRMATG